MTADPWALLREARKLIHTTLDIDALRDWARESDDGEPSLDDLLRHLRANIDAALAERQDSAKDVVEWTMRDIVDYPIQHALLGEAELVVFPNIFEPVSQWHWKTGFMGEAATEAEAKEAAIAAARGMK